MVALFNKDFAVRGDWSAVVLILGSVAGGCGVSGAVGASVVVEGALVDGRRWTRGDKTAVVAQHGDAAVARDSRKEARRDGGLHCGAAARRCGGSDATRWLGVAHEPRRMGGAAARINGGV